METDFYREGMACLERGEVEQGRRLLEAAWEAEPGSVEVARGLAQALDLAGERLRALELLERAHTQAPTEPGPACDLAMLYLELEQETRAEQILLPVLAAHPEHPRANLHMAMALAKQAPQRARDHAAKALLDTEPERRRQAEALHRLLSIHSQE